MPKFCRNKHVPVYITGKNNLTKEDISFLLMEAEVFDRKYEKNEDYFYGKMEILNRTFTDTTKPNNKVMCNIPKYIVQVRSGFFSSSPLTLESQNEQFMDDVQRVLDYNDFKRVFNDLDVYCSIYGHAFLVMYLNDEGRIAFKPQKPTDWLMVHDNTLEQKPKFAIRYYAYWDDIENQQFYDIELWTDEEIIKYEGNPTQLEEVGRRPHYFGQLPVIEFLENDSRHGSYEDVISLIDIYNKMLSDTANTIDYFSDCYMVLSGMEQTTAEDIARMKNDRILLVPEGCDASFLTKEINENYNEHMLRRLQEQIFVIACTPLLSDSSFSSNSSGVAINFKLFSMEKSVQLKENIFANGFTKMFAMIRNMLNLMERKSYGEEDTVIMTFTRSLPMDLSALADSISKLQGTVSRRTLMSQLDFISDVNLEEEQLMKERKEDMDFQMEYIDAYAAHMPEQQSTGGQQQGGAKQPSKPKVGNDNA